MKPSTKRPWDKALCLWLGFLKYEGFVEGDPLFVSPERASGGMLVNCLALFAEYTKVSLDRADSKTLMQDLSNEFEQRGQNVAPFSHPLVLSARKDRKKTARQLSEERDAPAKAALTPEMWNEFFTYYWVLTSQVLPRTRESTGDMTTG